MKTCPKCGCSYVHDGKFSTTNCDLDDCHFSTRPRLLTALNTFEIGTVWGGAALWGFGCLAAIAIAFHFAMHII